MPSTFSWLDYSDHERRRVLDVVELFGEKTTVDEIGIGSVRDAFADAWFPGTSTIQTTAKYFLLVPWTYISLESKSIGADRIADYARKLEIKTIQSLVDSGAKNGVIGRIARDSLQRLPSGVYWQGLATWGIRRFDGSQDVYQRTIDRFYAHRKVSRSRHIEFEGESPESSGSNWDPELPPVPSNFPDGVKMELSFDEASYLQHRVINSCPDSMLAFLMRENTDVKDESFLWNLELALPPSLRSQLSHGQMFSEIIHGAQLLYNVILAELKAWDEQLEKFREAWKEWTLLIKSRNDDIQRWDLSDFWTVVYRSNPRVGNSVRTFIERWIELVCSTAAGESMWDSAQARDVIKMRERQIKKGLARVLGGRPLELWGGESGTAQLDFRWRSTRRIYLDIQSGLEQQ